MFVFSSSHFFLNQYSSGKRRVEVIWNELGVFIGWFLIGVFLSCLPPPRHTGAEKSNAFIASPLHLPPAPSRTPGFGVHWSEAETFARKERTHQAQGLARKDRRIR
jgi:hypothetical protein